MHPIIFVADKVRLREGQSGRVAAIEKSGGGLGIQAEIADASLDSIPIDLGNARPLEQIPLFATYGCAAVAIPVAAVGAVQTRQIVDDRLRRIDDLVGR